MNINHYLSALLVLAEVCENPNVVDLWDSLGQLDKGIFLRSLSFSVFLSVKTFFFLNILFVSSPLVAIAG